MEVMRVEARGDSYEDAITHAMLDLKNFIHPDAHVYRNEDECNQHMKDWFLYGAEGGPTPGRQSVVLMAEFVLAGSDT